MPETDKNGTRKIAKGSHYAKVLKLFSGWPQGNVLDLPTGTGVIVQALRDLGFTVQPADIDTAKYAVPGPP